MKLHRFIIVIPLVIVYLFIPSSLFQFIILLFLLVYSLDFFYSYILHRTIKITRADSIIRGFTGLSFEVVVTITNYSILPVYGAVFNDYTGNLMRGDSVRRVVSIPPKKQFAVKYQICSHERGEYSIGPAKLRLKSFFSAHELHITTNQSTSVIIFPKLFPSVYAPHTGMPQGPSHSYNLINEDLTQYRSIREYSPGDEFKRINWKIAARTGKLITNQYEYRMESPLISFLDLGLKAYSLKRRYLMVEAAISIAASLACAASLAKQKTGIYAIGVKNADQTDLWIPPLRDSSIAILDSLARIQATETSDETLLQKKILTLPNRSTIVYIGPNKQAGCLRLAELAQKRGCSYIQYLADLSQSQEQFFMLRKIPTEQIESYEIA